MNREQLLKRLNMRLADVLGKHLRRPPRGFQCRFYAPIQENRIDFVMDNPLSGWMWSWQCDVDRTIEATSSAATERQFVVDLVQRCISECPVW